MCVKQIRLLLASVVARPVLCNDQIDANAFTFARAAIKPRKSTGAVSLTDCAVITSPQSGVNLPLVTLYDMLQGASGQLFRVFTQ